jgi:hypothetical protein
VAQSQAVSSALEWSPVPLLLHPPALAYASAAYDADNGTVVLFGGIDARGRVSNQTWVWNGTTWTDFPETQSPPARDEASMAFDPDLHQLILYGGRNASGQTFSDTWAWNGASWYHEPLSAFPPAREAATMASDGSELVLFGGDTGQGPAPDSPIGSTSTSSPSASAASITAAPSDPHAVLGDTWLWDGTTWTQSPAAGPGARSGAAMSYDSAKHDVVLFGGQSTPVDTGPPSLSGDTWTWNGSGWKRAAPHASPSARNGAAVADDPVAGGVILTGGGTGAGGAAGDTWLWTGSNWTRTSLPEPAPRVGAATTYDADSQQLVLFGGRSGGSVHDDTYVLGLAQGRPAGGSPATTPAGPAGPSTSVAHPARPGASGGSSGSTGSSTTVATNGPASGSGGGHRTEMVVHPTQRITLSGTGYRPGSPIVIWFESTPEQVGGSTADRFGRFRAAVTVPASAALGLHHFEVDGTGGNGQARQVTVPVSVVTVGHSRATTRQTLVMVGVAVLIPLAAWVALIGSERIRARTRRRRPPEGLAQ